MNDLSDTWVVIPAFNEGPVIREVINAAVQHCPNVIVVDDGSSDNTVAQIRDLKVQLIQHPINLGQGAAIESAFAFISRQNNSDTKYVVTFDADGQMDPAEIAQLVQNLRNSGVDLVLGTRATYLAEVPRFRRFILKLALIWTRFTTGLNLSDTHNGFRAFKINIAKQIHFRSSGMAHSSELLHLIAKKRWSFCEVPVRLRYTPYSLKKGQSSLNFFNILWDLLFN